MLEKEIKQLLNELTSKLKERLKGNLTSVILFGSVARGSYKKDSDIDLLVVCKNLPNSISKRIDIFNKIEDSLTWNKKLEKRGYFLRIAPLLRTEAEVSRISPLYLDMTTDAKFLFDRNSFFQSILSRIRSRLREYGAIKIKIGKLWYWDLKPDYKFGEVIEIE